MKTFEVFVDTVPLPLSARTVRTLKRVDLYDRVVFTSKSALKFFEAALRTRKIPVPRRKFLRVGPRADLLKLDLHGKHVLFARSKLAPFDIVSKLRAKGVVVAPIVLYTAVGRTLSTKTKRGILLGQFKQLYFKSPSGIQGFLRQFSASERKTVRHIPALCIGTTTEKAARDAGFKKVSIKGTLRR